MLTHYQNHALSCCHEITDPRDEHIVQLHNISNKSLVDVRRKRQIIMYTWRNINNGIIEIATPVRQTRAAMTTTIYLPILHTETYKKSVFYCSRLHKVMLFASCFTPQGR